AHRGLAVELVIEVGGTPLIAGFVLPAGAVVVDRRAGRPALQEGSGVDNWLDRRPRLALAGQDVHLPVDILVVVVKAALEGEDLTGARVDGDERRVVTALLLNDVGV